MKTLFIVFAMIYSALLPAASLNNMVVFGDSLSDNGNLYEYMKHQLPVSPPYYKGRFSNGPIWVELLIQSYYPTHSNDHLLDYAYGGAGVLEGDDYDEMLFTLHREIDTYFLAHQDKADEKSLFVVWIGSNNYLGAPEEADKTVDDVIYGLELGLRRLADQGAKYILVVNVPDLGRTPAAVDFEAVDRLTYISKRHNDLLQKKVEKLKTDYPAIQWIYFDINLVFDDMINEPGRFGFTNTTNTCYEDTLSSDESSRKSLLHMVSRISRSGSKKACDGFLFFDPVHPTAPAHVLMAYRTKLMLDKMGVDFHE
jgi:phospholipase/lecithinase/hemolysin